MKDAPAFKTWMPEYAIDERGKIPDWVWTDFRTGVALRLASQGLHDALMDLEADDG